MRAYQQRVADALFTKTQRQVLGLLFGRPERSFYANEIVRLARCGIGAVQRELARLEAAGLVSSERVGNQRHYRARRESPIFMELRGIVAKAFEPARTARSVRASRSRAPRARRAGEVVAPAVPASPAIDASAPRSRKLRIPLGRLAELCRVHGIRRLGLFGPAARAEPAPGEAIDLLAEFEPGQAPAPWSMPEIEDAFSGAFERRRVAIATSEILDDPVRRRAILAEVKTLYPA